MAIPRFRTILRRTLLALALLLLIAFIATAWIGSGHLVSPPRHALQDYQHKILAQPADYGLSIIAFTGPSATPCLLVSPAVNPGVAKKSRQLRAALTQRGIELPPWGDLRGTVILLHAHTGRKEDMLPVCERFCAAGLRCIIPDLPGHGDHPSSIASFGKIEGPLIETILDDTLITFALPDQPTFLFGVSQGAAIALQTAALHPERWAGVASAASFASLDRPLRVSAESLHPQLRRFAPISSFAVACGAWARAGIWPADISPSAAAKSLTIPVFIAHSENDEFIPISQAHEIFEALPSDQKTFRLVVGSDHNHVLAADAAQLYPDICAFFLSAHDSSHFK